ncbi:Methyltransferase domain protein [Candidatus Bilamarchaeum dharawalense]|uniref:Methyltransferase domain protein n=1 Tax=Candidatus Bilamarchaeum dharawalense TaxID=2885759 RepID=A0A5E4LWW3_9ARCH|nr:Methyltransferase domain protein [Candidatus Bilamarchaeum dharawalense]
MILEALLVLFALVIVTHIIDYYPLKLHYFKKQKWDLNIGCGPTDGGGLNADVVPRKVPNFVLIKDIYHLPFKNKQFKTVMASHIIEHVDDPEKFYKELSRVSENVIFLIPPVWDLAAAFNLPEHKWHFLTLGTKFVNTLPARVKLPYWWYHNMFGQRIE